MKDSEKIKRAFVHRDEQGDVMLQELKEPALIFYNVLVFVACHIPLPSLAPLPFPEEYCADLNVKMLLHYRQLCEKFYKQLEETGVSPNKSFNMFDILPCYSARVTDEYIDMKIDSRWSCFRVPRDSVIILTPTSKIQFSKKLKSIFESHIIHETN